MAKFLLVFFKQSFILIFYKGMPWADTKCSSQLGDYEIFMQI